MKRRYSVIVYQAWEVDVETDEQQLLADRVADVFIKGDLWLTDFMAGETTVGDTRFREAYGFDVVHVDMMDERVECGDGFGLYGVEIKEEVASERV